MQSGTRLAGVGWVCAICQLCNVATSYTVMYFCGCRMLTGLLDFNGPLCADHGLWGARCWFPWVLRVTVLYYLGASLGTFFMSYPHVSRIFFLFIHICFVLGRGCSRLMVLKYILFVGAVPCPSPLWAPIVYSH